jgi:hypothetical protein
MPSQQFTLWLEFEHWSDDDDPEDDFFNMKVTLEDGCSYALNVWTFKFFERVRALDRSTGDCLHGAYLVTPDLLVERLDRLLMERIIADMLDNEGLKNEWLVPKNDDEDIEDNVGERE